MRELLCKRCSLWCERANALQEVCVIAHVGACSLRKAIRTIRQSGSGLWDAIQTIRLGGYSLREAMRTILLCCIVFVCFQMGALSKSCFFVFPLGEKCETHHLLRVFRKSAKNIIF